MWTVNFLMFKLVLEKAEEPEIKLPTSTGSLKKQESSRKTSISALLTMPKPLTVWITINWKILKEMGITDHLICLFRNLYAGQEATVRTGHEITDWFQIGKGVHHQIRSDQISCSVVSDSLWPHELQHARPPFPSPTPGIHSDSCPLSQWCHLAISSSVVPFSSCPQSLPASGSFQTSQLFTWGGQSTGVSASASVLPMNTQDWSPLGWTGWISLQSKGLSRVLSNTTVQKHQFFGTQLSSQSNSHIHTWPQEKP